MTATKAARGTKVSSLQSRGAELIDAISGRD